MSFDINVFAILTIHSCLFDIFFLRRSSSFYFRHSIRSTFSFLTKVRLTVRAEWIISHHKSIFNLIAELEDVISSTNYHDTFEGFLKSFRFSYEISDNVSLPWKQLLVRWHPFGTPLTSRRSSPLTAVFSNSTKSTRVQSFTWLWIGDDRLFIRS